MARTSSLRALGSGRKYGVVRWIVRVAEAISVWNNIRARVDRPYEGELLMTRAIVLPSTEWNG